MRRQRRREKKRVLLQRTNSQIALCWEIDWNFVTLEKGRSAGLLLFIVAIFDGCLSIYGNFNVWIVLACVRQTKRKKKEKS